MMVSDSSTYEYNSSSFVANVAHRHAFSLRCEPWAQHQAGFSTSSVLMSAQPEEAVNKAKRVASESAQHAKETASETANQAKASGQHAEQAAEESAESLTQKAKSVVDSAAETAKNAKDRL
eukprot:scaffold176353_cov35-Prasinocladus_malaysianus.AAC.1